MHYSHSVLDGRPRAVCRTSLPSAVSRAWTQRVETWRLPYDLAVGRGVWIISPLPLLSADGVPGRVGRATNRMTCRGEVAGGNCGGGGNVADARTSTHSEGTSTAEGVGESGSDHPRPGRLGSASGTAGAGGCSATPAGVGLTDRSRATGGRAGCTMMPPSSTSTLASG